MGDLAEPGDVLRAREDARADHRDPGKKLAVPRHSSSCWSMVCFATEVKRKAAVESDLMMRPPQVVFFYQEENC